MYVCDPRHVLEGWTHVTPRTKHCWLTRATLKTYSAQQSLRTCQAAAQTQPWSEPESAASLVWNLPATHAHTTAVLHALFMPNQTVERLIPLGLSDVHPDVLTKDSFTQCMMMNLLSRHAVRYKVTALMLSANYLPSQLTIMQGLADRQAVLTQAYISSSSIHFLLHKPNPSADVPAAHDRQLEMDDIAAAFADAVEKPMQRLTAGSPQWQAADMEERNLQQQLRLWEPATWSSMLQQTLESRTSIDSILAIRSLMGPPARAAAQRLVEKKKLFWLELQADQVADYLAGCSKDSRRRPKKVKGSKGNDSAQGCMQSICHQDLVFIGRRELSLKDALQLPPEVYTDYCISSSTSPGASATGFRDMMLPSKLSKGFLDNLLQNLV